MDPVGSILSRAWEDVGLGHLSTENAPVDLGACNVHLPERHQYILRMCVNRPDRGWMIPPELDWLSDTIFRLAHEQSRLCLPKHPFCYVTVRHGVVSSTTDDAWHVDGFSTRIAHKPEQNYIWCNRAPTEFVRQAFPIPTGFDPLRHNIHWHLQDNVDPDKVCAGKSSHLYLLDPYVVHRRPKLPDGFVRSFFRVSFVPIEIRDDTCTPNPIDSRRTYGTDDFRNQLERYSDASSR